MENHIREIRQDSEVQADFTRHRRNADNQIQIQVQIQIIYLTQTCIFLRHKKITLIIICLYTYMSWRSSKGYVAASARPPNLKYSFNN